MRSFRRSTAMEYWMRSFVPMLKKRTSRERWSATRTALGVSIMTPTSIHGLKGIPSPASSCLHSSRMALARLSSSMPEIMGYMTRMLFNTAARKIARSCVLKMAGFSRQNRIARQPRKGFSSSQVSRLDATLSPPISSVRMMTLWGKACSAALRYCWSCSSSVGGVVRFR